MQFNANNKRKDEQYLLYITCIIYFIIFATIMFKDIQNAGDLMFHKNRLEQIKYNLSTGYDVSYFYNDFYGTGYGSSFFYGNLTLIPFALFNVEIGIKLYILVTFILLIVGTYQFVKVFTIQNRYFVTFMILCSEFFLYDRYTGNTYPNYLAFALSMLCLAEAVKYFRDKNKKSGYVMCLYYFLIVNTHFLSAIFTAVALIIVCLWYFDKARIKDYLKYIGIVLLLIGYNIVNILYHSDVLSADVTNEINQKLLSSDLHIAKEFNITNLAYTYLHSCPLFTFNLILLILTIIVTYKKILKKQMKVRHYVLFATILVLALIGTPIIWQTITQKFYIFFQYPIRYGYYILPVVYIYFFRNTPIKLKTISKIVVVITTLVYMFFGLRLYYKPLNDLGKYIGNGEYLNTLDILQDREDFNYNRTHIVNLTDKEEQISYENYGNGIKFDYKVHNDFTVLQIPKLYYRGYVAEDVNTHQQYEVLMGKNQWINIVVTDSDKHTFYVHYQTPLFLYVLRYISFTIFMTILGYLIISRIKKGSEYRIE